MMADPRKMESLSLLPVGGTHYPYAATVIPQRQETASILNNYLLVDGGMLLPRPRYEVAGSTNSGGTYPTSPVVHQFSFYQQDGIDWVAALMNKNSTTMALWRTPFADIKESSGVWTFVADITMTASDWSTLQFDTTMAFDKQFVVHPNLDGIGVWDPSGGWTTIGASANAPSKLRCIQFHKQRVFAGGGWDEGGANKFYSRLWYSDVADATSAGTWNAAATTYSQYIDVNDDDGEPIEALLPYNDGMLIAKRTSMWFLAGDGPNSFELIKVANRGGRGPQSIALTPVGVAMGNEEGFYLWGGGGEPIRISASIDGYIQNRLSSKYMQVESMSDSILFMTDADATFGSTYVFDINEKRWHGERGPSNTAAWKVIKSYLVRGAYFPSGPTTTNFPLMMASTRPSPSDTILSDESVGTVYKSGGSANSQDFIWATGSWELGQETPVTLRHLDIYLTSGGFALTRDDALQVIVYNEDDTAMVNTYLYNDEQFSPAMDWSRTWVRYRIDLGATVRSLSIAFYQTVHTDSNSSLPFGFRDVVLRFQRGMDR